MFKRILIVLEPHLDVAATLQASTALAGACDAEVLFHCRQPPHVPSTADGAGTAMPADANPPDAPRTQSEQLLAQAHRAAMARGVLSRTVGAADDDPVAGVLDATRHGRCDLIVVASAPGNAVTRLLTGNIIPGLVTASPVPLLVCTPAQVPTPVGESAARRRVMVVLEDSDQHATALTQGVELARACGADLVFAHIVALDVVPMMDLSGFAAGAPEQLAAEFRLQSHRVLASACTVARAAGLAARGLSLQAGGTARSIAQLAADEACDLIVVAHEGRNAVVRLLTGSLIPGLITAATVPVLICRTPEEAARKPASRRRRRRRGDGTSGVAAPADDAPRPGPDRSVEPPSFTHRAHA